MTDATPPRRIISACSVKAVNLEIGYSRFDVVDNTSAELGVTKNDRPAGVSFLC